MVTYGMPNYASASLEYIGNWTDGSFILNPSFLYPLHESLSLQAGFFVPLGDKGGELNRPETGFLFYIWMKINF